MTAPPPSTSNEGPSHPTGRAILLMVGVTLLIVVAATLASFDVL